MVHSVLIACTLFYLILMCHSEAVNEDVVHDLIKRIDMLENKGKAQEMLIKNLQERVYEVGSKINLGKQETEHIKALNDRTDGEIKLGSNNGDEIQQISASHRKKVKRSQNSILTDTLLNPGTYSTGTVAFHATIDTNTGWPYAVSHLTVGQVIVFDSVKLNVGGGYHQSTGLFIAPTPGIYMFSASVMTKGEISLNIVKNGVPLAGVFAASRQQGSVTIVTELKVGDEMLVRVQSPNDAYIWGDRLTSFSGSLIQSVS
ncbi:cerebellin-3-like [Mercenaria mercenaria]|uniref:cerebellin-3-like n=1 Tax=Mercenaria mercenaria TaxID=6596 RepID=UPI00234E48DF|nr:cerebellin-3-like [Mercenaria mercenaria]